MRIVVTGRPDPPLPADVPRWHPLRIPGVMHQLAPSEHAQDVRELAQHELRRLLAGGPVEQLLVGVLAAARGGLTITDLAELTGQPPWKIAQVLLGTAGRTFTRRGGQGEADVYVFGHEELQHAAIAALGQKLTSRQNRLHEWADTYRDQGWPATTPRYLLLGYFRMLTVTADLARLVGAATDPARHDRMLDLTGGDAAAIAETWTALSLVAAQDSPDTATALTLARHRDRLARRGNSVPTDLPAVWAVLGQSSRAEALIRSVTHPRLHAELLVTAVEVLARSGRRGGAWALARSFTDSDLLATLLVAAAEVEPQAGPDQQTRIGSTAAVRLARSVTDQHDQAGALTLVARVLVKAGRREFAAAAARCAEAVVHALPDHAAQAHELALVADALALAGDYGHAEVIAWSISDVAWQASALRGIAHVLVDAGHAEEAERLARSVTGSGQRNRTLQEIAGALAAVGQYERARSLMRELSPVWQAKPIGIIAASLACEGRYEHARATVAAISDAGERERAASAVARELARAGRPVEAEAVARSLSDSSLRRRALVSIAAAFVRTGRHARAEALLSSLGRLSWTDADTELTEALVETDDYEKAVDLLLDTLDGGSQATLLVAVAEALARRGRPEPAAAAARRAGERASSFYVSPLTVREVAVVLARTGQHDEAVTLARSVLDDDAYWQASSLEAVAEVLVDAGRYQEAEAVVRSVSDPYWQEGSLGQTAARLAAAGRYEHAETVAASLTNPYIHAEVLVAVAKAMACAGEHQQAATVATRAEAAIRVVVDPDERAQALAVAAHALARAGQRRQAVELADEAVAALAAVTVPGPEAKTLITVALALAEAGRRRRAAATAKRAETAARVIDTPHRTWHIAPIAATFARVGRHRRATRFARSIYDPAQQGWALTEVAVVQAETGRYRRAILTARSLTRLGHSWTGLLAVAEQLARSGRHKQAARLAAKAVDPRADIPPGRGTTIGSDTAVLAGLTLAGQHAQAESMAHATEPDRRAWALATLASTAASLGQADRAAELATQAEAAARDIAPPGGLDYYILADLANTHATAHRHARAAALACEVAAATPLETEERVSGATSPAEHLVPVIETLTHAGQNRLAGTVAARLCFCTDWLTALRPVLMADPRALSMIADLRPARSAARSIHRGPTEP